MQINRLEGTPVEELQKARSVIMQFINSCSHSLRGPLKSIEGLVNLLMESKKQSPADQRIFDLIKTTLRKMDHMLDELHHFLENSRHSVSHQLADPKEVMALLLEQFQGEICEAGIEIHFNQEQSAPFYSDITRLRLILSNVLANAIHFRDHHKDSHQVEINIRATAENCKIRISDNGIGIDEENQEKIFQVFFRASEQSAGSGIGLYVVHETIKKMGGTIEIDSFLGEGSEFTITLPNLGPPNLLEF